MDNKIMYKKILTTIAFIATIGLSQSATVSTLSMGTGMHEAVGIAKDDVGYLYMGDTNGKIQRIKQLLIQVTQILLFLLKRLRVLQ